VINQTRVNLVLATDVANTILTGTLGDDFIWGANGPENLTGLGGNDTFLYNAANASDDTITDFTKAGSGDEQDFLDFSDLLTGYDAGTDDLSQFLNVSQTGGSDTLIKVDKDGTGGYTEMTLTLKDELATLEELQANGQLIL